MRIQVTLTVPETKRLIAKGVARRTDVQEAFLRGKIFLKGGTTVSAIFEELCGKPLWVCGRIAPRGTLSCRKMEEVWHCAIIEKGSTRNIDTETEIQQAVIGLKKRDIVIIGANAIDYFGHAALMFGTALGAGPGLTLSGMIAEVKKRIIAVGTEKMVPGNLNDIMRNTARSEVDLSVGMAVGLVPISGEIYTELEAIQTLAKVRPQIIGKGGIRGAEGATTLILDGERQEVLKVFQIMKKIRGMGESGILESFEECQPGKKCKFHLACIYAKKGRKERV